MQSCESMILTNTSVVNIFEYASKQIAVVTDKSELIIFKNGKVINKLQCPASKQSEYASVVSLPGFDVQWFPFLAWNMNGRVCIVHLTSSKITELIQDSNLFEGSNGQISFMFLLTKETLSIRYFSKSIEEGGYISIQSQNRSFNPFEVVKADEITSFKELQESTETS